MSKNNQSQQLTPFGHALAGALGAVFSNAVVYPLDTVKTRIQASDSNKDVRGPRHGRSKQSILALLQQILKTEGISGFYKGFGATMLNTFSTQYMYFFFYSFVRSSYIKRVTKVGEKPKALSTAAELILGAVAGALAQIFTIPVSVIATRQQVGHSVTVKRAPKSPDPFSAPSSTLATKPSTSHQVTFADVAREGHDALTSEDENVVRDDSFLAVARDIIREDGITGLWLGIHSSLVLTVNPAITYGVFERVKSITTLGDPTVKLGPWYSFYLGALSKSLATVVTYPYIMAKVRVQAHGSRPEANKATAKYNGAVDVLKKVYKSQGLTGWYKGMGAQILKAVLAQALLFMSKDQFERYALILMITWQRLMSAASL